MPETPEASGPTLCGLHSIPCLFQEIVLPISKHWDDHESGYRAENVQVEKSSGLQALRYSKPGQANRQSFLFERKPRVLPYFLKA